MRIERYQYVMLWAFVIIGVIAFSLIALLAKGEQESGSSNQDFTESIFPVFSDKNCTRACWQGIEPGVANRAKVENMLAREGIEYYIDYDAVDSKEAIFTWLIPSPPYSD